MLLAVEVVAALVVDIVPATTAGGDLGGETLWDGLHLSMPSRLGLADHNPLHTCTFKFARCLFVRKCLSWRGVVVPSIV